MSSACDGIHKESDSAHRAFSSTHKEINDSLVTIISQTKAFLSFPFSSVLPPKDECFLRAERELVLRRELQVGLEGEGEEGGGRDRRRSRSD